jgi:tetratricopeptide (TPR) repeat protein
MILFAQAVMLMWLPIVVVFYIIFPPRKAMVCAFVVGWLFLPNIVFHLPAVPDYGKMTATSFAVLFAMVMFNSGKLFALRPRWYDLPIVVWCLCPFASAMLNGLGSHEGASAVLDQSVSWGIPYLIGRVYLTDLDGLVEMATGIVIGGLVYIPFCLFEMRFSPIVSTTLYGVGGWGGVRYGGYRPSVFLQNGLELGMWMTNATLLCCLLWACGTIKTIRNIPFGQLTFALVVTTVLCRSTGALLLLITSFACLGFVKWNKRPWVIWVLMAIAPLYITTRALNIWTGDQIVAFSSSAFGADRAQSYGFRLEMERKLADKALQRPVSGWGRFDRASIFDSKGKRLTIPDGFWIITLGSMGTLGMASLVLMMLLPMGLTTLRFPAERWFDPQIGPMIGLAMILVVMMLDFLSNAQLNPIYPLLMGGVMGQPKYRPGGDHREVEGALAFASEMLIHGRTAEAEHELRRVIELASAGEDAETRQIHAEALDGLGRLLLETGRHEEAELSLRDALVLRDWLAVDSPDPDRFRDLAIARDGLSRALAESGRTAEAVGERQIALQIWEILAADHPRNAEYRDHKVNTLNDLAWLLAADPNPGRRDPARSLLLAEEAVRVSADHDACWNTLGVARYRVGDWAGAIEALERSALSSPGGLGTAFDHYFLAMSWCQLQRDDQAREWLERGVAWASRHRPGHATLARFREEAESLLEGGQGATVVERS